MPQYFFDVTNGHRVIDPAGLKCRDDKGAMAKDNVIADQIASDAPNSSSRHVAVLDDDDERNEVGEVAISGPGDDTPIEWHRGESGGLAGGDRAEGEGR